MLTLRVEVPASRQAFSAYTGEEEGASLIRSWVDHCDDGHPTCTVANQNFSTRYYQPSRLLQVCRREDGDFLILKDTKLLDTAEVTYVTLSHCWGEYTGLKLCNETQAALSAGIPLEKLSQTFQDAARLTAQLGEQYIWIDALCILQDSNADWQLEGSKMCEVYSRSVVNIMAADSSGGDGGLFRFRNPLAGSACHITPSWTGFEMKDLVCYDPNYYNRFVVPSVLLSRAWVIQERLLSKRNVIFTKDRIYWECRTHVASEPFPDQVPEDGEWWKTWTLIGIARRIRRRHIPLRHWNDVIEKYSRCGLTQKTDKLIALSGLVQDLDIISYTDSRYEHLGKYLAGMWENQMCHQLLWTTTMESTTHRFPYYVAPSWSWASVDGPILGSFNFGRDEESDILATVLEANTTSQYAGFGTVTGGSLLIRGSLRGAFLLGSFTDATNENDESKRNRLKPGSRVNFLDGDMYAFYGDGSDSFEVAWDDLNEEVKPLPLYFLAVRHHRTYSCGRLEGLLLRPTEKKRGQYRRVGVLTITLKGPLSNFLDSRDENLPVDSFRDCTAAGSGKTRQYTIQII